MGGINFSIYFPDGSSEEARWFAKLRNRSEWVLMMVEREIMDKERIRRRIRDLEDELGQEREILAMIESRESEKRESEVEKDAIKREFIKKEVADCPVCSHPQKSEINDALSHDASLSSLEKTYSIKKSALAQHAVNHRGATNVIPAGK